jgi:hypothetical protein
MDGDQQGARDTRHCASDRRAACRRATSTGCERRSTRHARPDSLRIRRRWRRRAAARASERRRRTPARYQRQPAQRSAAPPPCRRTSRGAAAQGSRDDRPAVPKKDRAGYPQQCRPLQRRSPRPASTVREVAAPGTPPRQKMQAPQAYRLAAQFVGDAGDGQGGKQGLPCGNFVHGRTVATISSCGAAAPPACNRRFARAVLGAHCVAHTPSPRKPLVETCRAALEWAVAEWRPLAGEPDDRSPGPRPSEEWRLPTREPRRA